MHAEINVSVLGTQEVVELLEKEEPELALTKKRIKL